MVLNNYIEVFTKFKISWLSTTFLSVSFVDFLPIISQIVLVLSLQIISIMVDYVRNRLKLKARISNDLELPEVKKDSFNFQENESYLDEKK